MRIFLLFIQKFYNKVEEFWVGEANNLQIQYLSSAQTVGEAIKRVANKNTTLIVLFQLFKTIKLFVSVDAAVQCAWRHLVDIDIYKGCFIIVQVQGVFFLS